MPMEVILQAISNAVSAAVGAICEALDYARRRFGQVETGTDPAYAPTAEDQRLIEESRAVLRTALPRGIPGMLDLSLEQRVEVIRQLTQGAAGCYGISISRILFTTSDQLLRDGYPPNTFGYYLHETDAIIFNIDLLSMDGVNTLRDAVDTVFHECRHAYQYRVVTDAGYLHSGDPTVQAWCYNFVHYNTAGADLEAYYNQAIEVDARNFAARIMEGF